MVRTAPFRISTQTPKERAQRESQLPTAPVFWGEKTRSSAPGKRPPGAPGVRTIPVHALRNTKSAGERPRSASDETLSATISFPDRTPRSLTPDPPSTRKTKTDQGCMNVGQGYFGRIAEFWESSGRYDTIQVSWSPDNEMTRWEIVKNYFGNYTKHARRAFFARLSEDVTSSAENRYIEKGLLKNDTVDGKARNFLVFRRSFLFTMLVMVVTWAIFEVIEVSNSFGRVGELEATSRGNLTFNIVDDPDGFGGYTQRMGEIAIARTMVTPERSRCFVYIILCLLSWAAVAMNVMALMHWHHPRESANYVLIGWLCVFLAPFLLSVIPIRLFVTSDGFDEVFDVYKEEFKDFFQVEEREEDIMGLCQELIDTNGTDNVASLITSTCNTITSVVPNSKVSIPWPISVKFDGRIVHDSCDQAQAFIDEGNLDDALETMQGGCQQFKDEAAAIASCTDVINCGSSSYLINYMEKVVDQVRIVTEVSISGMYALMDFKVMAPAALSLAPGMLRGAVKAKGLVPQSSIPGMFIVIMPWLYTPLIWTIYNVVFQLIGDVWLLLGLIILAYSPLGYFVMGTFWFNIAEPMSDSQVNIAVKRFSYYTLGCFSIAYTLLACWLVQPSNSYFAEQMFKHMFQVEVMWFMVIGILSQYLYTTIAGIDFMFQQIIRQREYDLALEYGEKASVQISNWNRGRSKSQTAKAKFEQRNKRLDDLIKVLAFGKKPRE